MKKKIGFSLALVSMFSLNLMADDTTKFALKPNRTLVYNKKPSKVDSFSKMFTEGMFYGRIRSNNFYFDWKNEYTTDGGKRLRKDNYAMGLGGSIEYKTATFKGFSGEAIFYGSESPVHMDSEDVKYVKAGKDTFSRYEVMTSGNWGLYSLAVANIDYKISKTDIRVGRQKFESFLTKSNDTKMIPNTFEGAVITSKDLDKTTIKLAYLTRQKLRDHTTFHDVITFKNADGERWANNDDSVVHRGLSYENLKEHGKDTDNDLIVAQLDNNSIKNLKVMLNYTAIPSLFSSATIEAKYKIPFSGWSVTPAVRYMQQFDNGAGEVGGANLLTVTTGYKNPNSVDSYLVCAKLDFKFAKTTKLRLGYSSTADKADIIAPWRGLPTAGYTRAMGQYNWFANTQTYLARVDYSLDKAKLVDGMSIMFRYAHQNFDEKKTTIMTDSDVYNFDMIYNAPFLKGFETRVRFAYVDAKPYDNIKTSPSYTDSRLEFNYLF